MTKMAASVSMESRRPLSASMFRPKRAPSLAASPEVEKLARKLAEAQAGALSGLSSAPWRVTIDRIAEETSSTPEEQGLWARVESAAGSMTFHHNLDRSALSALCESAMGGTGTEEAFDFGGRPLSAIEKEIARTIGMRLCAGVATTLSEHLGTPVRLFEGAIAPDDATANRQMVAMHFIANVFGYSGDIRMAMPVSELQTQLAARGADLDPVPASDDCRQALQRQIGQAETLFTLSLGPETMRVDEIASLIPGGLVRLSATTASPVIVSSGGTPLFEASLARSGDRLAVRITAPVP
jgi:flagellar motor switch protein FliM